MARSTLTAAPGTVTTALDGLTFTPVVPASSVYVTTTGFTIGVHGQGGSASDNTTTVTTVQQVLGLTSVAFWLTSRSRSPPTAPALLHRTSATPTRRR